GYRTLAREWPSVADAFDEALARGREAEIRQQAKAMAEAPPPSLAEVIAALDDVLRHAPEGLLLIVAECGLGKTASAIRIAIERALRPYATANAKGVRAPDHSKTGISVDKHTLALQIVSDLLGAGTAARRHFGPLSLQNPDGSYVCHFRDVA